MSLSKNSKSVLKSILQADSLVRQFARYAVPTVLAAWVYSAYTIVDGIFIGRYVGDSALAAINLLIPLLYLPYAFSVMIGVGGATLSARLLGERRPEAAQAAFTQALWMILWGGLGFTLLLYFGAPTLLHALGARGELLNLGVDYLRTGAWFTVFASAGYALALFLRIEGAARFGLYCLLLGALVNALFDYLLIARFGWGMQGAALATGIAQCLSSSLMLGYHCVKARQLYPVRRAFASGWQVARMTYNGASEFLAEIAPAVTVMAFNLVILNKLGHDGLVAYAVLEYMTMSAVVTMVALVQSMQPMVSYYRGAGNRRAVRQSFQIGFWCVMAFSVLVAAALLLLSRPLTQLFLPDSLTAWAVLQGAVLWYALAFIPAGVNLAIAGYLTAIEAPGASSVIAVLRSWLLLLGLLWLLSELFGVSGIWFTLLGTELLTLAVSLWLYRRVAPRAYLRPAITPSKKPMPATAASVSHGRS